MAKKGYKHKTIVFRDEEMELYRKLQKLPYGDFSRITKKMWEERLRKEDAK